MQNKTDFILLNDDDDCHLNECEEGPSCTERYLYSSEEF